MKILLILFGSLAYFASSTGASAASANDLFVNRIILAGTNVTVSGNNYGAGEEPGEDIGGVNILWTYSVWYAWTAPTNGVVHLSGSTAVWNFYMSIRVYRGSAVNALALATSTPDGGVPVTAGDTIAIQVASIYYPVWGGGGGTGPFSMILALETPAPTSANDAFTNRFAITVPEYSFDGSIYGATYEPGEPLPTPNARQTLWWKLTPPAAGLLTLSPSAGQFNPAMGVYRGAQLGSLEAVSPLSGLSYQVEAGLEYAIQMAGENVFAGHCTLGARFYSMSNDLFSGSLEFEGTNASVHGDTLGATFESNEPNPGETNTIWFSWAAPTTGRVSFSPGPVWWRPMAVYAGPALDRLTAVRLVGVGNGVFGFLAEEGAVYHFQYAGESGDFTLSVQVEPLGPCTNDNFADALLVKGNVIYFEPKPVVGATMELGEPAHMGATPQKSIWWKWQAPVHGSFYVSPGASLVPNVVLSAYRGTRVEAVTLVGRAAGDLNFGVTGGETYYIAGAVPTNATGDIALYAQYNSTFSGSRAVLGNILREPSWEGTYILGARYWGMAGEISGSVNEPGGADGTTWPVLGGGARVWQDFATVPGQNHAIRFAFVGDNVRLRVSWDGNEVGVVTNVGEGSFWHWADFTAYAGNTTSRIAFANLGPMFANVAMDAFSVVPLTAPPAIVTQPSSASLFVAGTAAFVVGVNGSAPLTYSWYFNNAPLTVLTNSILLLESVTTNQAGTYRVVVSNPYGAVTSAPVTLTVDAPTKPVIFWQPYGDTVGVGGSYQFSVVAAGTPPLSYQWFLNGAELAGNTNHTLSFSAVDYTNAGIYSVRVQNHAGIVWSLGAKLIVTNAVNGGSSINFRNSFYSLFGTNVDAPVFDIDGVTPLNGSNFMAQLYGGPSLDLLRPAGQPSPFRTGFRAGYFYSQLVTLPTVPSGSNAIVQVRAWESSKGSSYEEARALGGKFGRSELLTVVLGDADQPPANLEGLASFNLRAGLPQLASGVIEFVERQPGGVVVWSHRGEPGFRYLIEKSVQGFEWRPFLVVTNVTTTVTFTDSANTGSNVTFYRSRILD